MRERTADDRAPSARPWTSRAVAVAVRNGLPLGLLFGLALAPFVPAILRGEVPFFLDIADHWYPFRLHAHRARQAGELAHWCRHVFCGTPFLGQLEAALAYPPHLLLDLFHPTATLLPRLVGHRFLVGLLVYVALRLRGADRWGSTLGGAVMILCGSVTLSVQQPAHLRAVAWCPSLLLGAHLVADGRRLPGFLWLAGGGAMAFLAGYPAYLVVTGFAVPILLLLHAGLPRSMADWRDRGVSVAVAGAAAGLAVALSMAQILPSSHLAGISQRSLGLAPELLDRFRATPTELLMLLVPRFTQDGGVVRAGFAYVGIAAAVLAVLAVLRRERGAAALGVVALAGLAVSLGRATPLGVFLQSMPGLRFFRNPSQYLLLVTLATSTLAGMGLSSWRACAPTRREIAISAGVPGSLFLLALLLPGLPADRASLVRVGIVAGSLLGAVVAWVLRARVRTATVLLAAIVIADAGTLGLRYAGRQDRTRTPAEIRASEPTLLAARDHHAATGLPGAPRVILSERFFNWENHGLQPGLEHVRGLFSLVPVRVLDVSRVIAEGAPFPTRPPTRPLYSYGPVDALDSPLLDLLAVQYACGFSARPPGDWTAVAEDTWVRDAVPPAWFPEVVHAVALGGACDVLARPGFSPRREAVVENAGSPPDSELVSARVTSLRLGTNDAVMEVEVDGGTPGFLLWTETHDDGWSATVDGDPVTVLCANHAFMAVQVPPGSHEVRFRYLSPGWRTGLAVSLSALLVWFGAVVAWFRRRRNPAGAVTVDPPDAP